MPLIQVLKPPPPQSEISEGTPPGIPAVQGHKQHLKWDEEEKGVVRTTK